MDPTDPAFAPTFLWGAASAGYQVERSNGAADWDVFANSPAIRERVARATQLLMGEAVWYEPSGPGVGHEDPAVLGLDIDRLASLGLTAYRFSVEWARVQPAGPDAPFDELALAHYAATARALVQRGIAPVVTLNHMSLPAWASTPPARTRRRLGVLPVADPARDEAFGASLGGWERGATVDAFERYVRAVVAAVRGALPREARVHWLTLNEPVASMLGVGYLGGLWPPGFSGESDRAARALDNLVRAHVRAYDAIKAAAPDDPVGFAHAVMAVDASRRVPAALSAALAGGGVLAARAALRRRAPLLAALAAVATAAAVGAAHRAWRGLHDAARERFEHVYTDYFLDAVARGEVASALGVPGAPPLAPAEVARFFGWPEGTAFQRRLDFVGINYYRRVRVRHHPLVARLVPFSPGVIDNDLRKSAEPHGMLNDLGWELYPDGLGRALARLTGRYALPVFVTENGHAEAVDANRAPSIVAHAEQLARGATTRPAGASSVAPRVIGYLHWTLVDNWEWHEGYSPRSRFGLFTTARTGQPWFEPGQGAPATPRRHLTEGAVALATIAAGRDVAAARARFGRLRADGSGVEPPTCSHGAVWTGALEGGEPVRLFLDSAARPPRDHDDADDARREALFGLIYYPRANLWLALLDAWAERGGASLAFRHAAHPRLGIPARSFVDVTLGDDHALRGLAARDDGARVAWTASRVGLHGLWSPAAHGADDAPGTLVFRAFDERGVVGKSLGPNGWQGFAVCPEGADHRVASFVTRGGAFTIACVSAAAGELTLERAGRARARWTYRRAPSSLRIVG